MRHNRRNKRLGRSYGERQAMLENMVSSLLVHQQIKTTLPKAKEAQRLAEKIITLGKEGSLHSKRRAFSFLQDHALTSKLFSEVAPRFSKRVGGYTRILRLDPRKGDNAPMALLELTEKDIKIKEAPKKKAGKAHKHGPAETEHKHGKAEHKDEPHKKGPEAKAEPKDKQAQPQKGFFRNISKFFRNKGGG